MIIIYKTEQLLSLRCYQWTQGSDSCASSGSAPVPSSHCSASTSSPPSTPLQQTTPNNQAEAQLLDSALLSETLNETLNSSTRNDLKLHSESFQIASKMISILIQQRSQISFRMIPMLTLKMISKNIMICCIASNRKWLRTITRMKNQP